jgi:hypothetical protein
MLAIWRRASGLPLICQAFLPLCRPDLIILFVDLLALLIPTERGILRRLVTDLVTTRLIRRRLVVLPLSFLKRTNNKRSPAIIDIALCSVIQVLILSKVSFII